MILPNLSKCNVSSGCVSSSPRSCLIIAALEVLHVRAGESDPSNAKLLQIVWNFGHSESFKDESGKPICITLAKNPHFYDELPTMNRYQGAFKRLPTSKYPDKISVIISNQFGELVEIESAPEGGTGWLFDRVLLAKKTLLFKS